MYRKEVERKMEQSEIIGKLGRLKEKENEAEIKIEMTAVINEMHSIMIQTSKKIMRAETKRNPKYHKANDWWDEETKTIKAEIDRNYKMNNKEEVKRLQKYLRATKRRKQHIAQNSSCKTLRYKFYRR